MAVRAIGSALLAGLAGVAGAEPSGSRDSLTVSLGLRHDEAELRFEDNGRTPDTRYTQLALELWSHELPGLDVGLTGGVARLSQDGDPATEGDAPTGEFIGLLVGRDWAVLHHSGVELRGEWVYHDLSDDDLDFEWFHAHGRIGLYTGLGRWRLSSGATAGAIRGERRLPGETRDFEADQNAGAYLRAALDVGRGGELSLTGEAGLRRAVMLRFTRAF